MTALRDPGRVVILGCGPTGCGAAFRFQELGYDQYQILDASEGPGGLAGSVVDDAGFTWDMGGHVQFSHYTYYDRVLESAVAGGWLWHDRESWVWIQNRFVPYPLQYNIHRLDRADRELILQGLRATASANKASAARNFAEWIELTYGRGLAEQFLFPYNEKVWGYPLESLAWSWIGERVARADLARIERNVLTGKDDTGWGPNSRFKFPMYGGTGAIWAAVTSKLRPENVRFRCKVVDIDTKDRRVRLASGESLSYDTLVSTLPLDVLAGITRPLDTEALVAAESLRHSSVHIIGVGLSGGRPSTLKSKCWMYFPESNSPYYRVTVFSNYSPYLVPEGEQVWSLMAEVCASEHRPVDASTLEAWTLDAMRADTLIQAEAKILSVWHRRLEHGYPTPTIDRDDALDAILPALQDCRIYSRGRFGGWKYEVSNQDHSFMQGVELVNNLVLDEPEVTLFDPARANSGEFLVAD